MSPLVKQRGILAPAAKTVIQKALQDFPVLFPDAQGPDFSRRPPAEASHDPLDVLPDAETLSQVPDEADVRVRGVRPPENGLEPVPLGAGRLIEGAEGEGRFLPLADVRADGR